MDCYCTFMYGEYLLINIKKKKGKQLKEPKKNLSQEQVLLMSCLRLTN